MGKTSVDRADLINELLRIKLRAMNSYVIDENLFCNLVDKVRVVEFQKKVFHQAQLILFLDEQSND